MTVYNLQEQRRGALERIQALILVQKKLLAGTSVNDPARTRIISILIRLRASEARLQAGLGPIKF